MSGLWPLVPRSSCKRLQSRATSGSWLGILLGRTKPRDSCTTSILTQAWLPRSATTSARGGAAAIPSVPKRLSTPAARSSTIPSSSTSAPSVTPTSSETSRTKEPVLTFEDVPAKYQDSRGLPFRKEHLKASEIVEVFGQPIDPDLAAQYIRVVHGRRVAGTLTDPELHRATDPNILRAYQPILSWLRKNVPVNETDSAGRRAHQELIVIDPATYTVFDPTGLYVPNAKRLGKDESPYGEGVLDKMRKEREQRKLEAEKAKKRKAELEEMTRKFKGERLGLPAVISDAKIQVAKRPKSARLQAYLDRANFLADDPPDYTHFQRLGPTTAFVVVVVAACVAFAVYYKPWPNERRLWPSIPPSASTLIGLLAANFIIFALWHHPPAFRWLNKYFVLLPGYPFAASALGSVFSHQYIKHLAENMIVVWIVGTRLHEDIGRGNFLALYLACGALGSLGSMWYFTLTRNIRSSSLGASGALYGIIGAYLWLHFWEGLHILGIVPPKELPGIPAWMVLACVFGYECWSITKKRMVTIDIIAHLSGGASGVAGAYALTWYAQQQQRSRALVKHAQG